MPSSPFSDLLHKICFFRCFFSFFFFGFISLLFFSTEAKLRKKNNKKKQINFPPSPPIPSFVCACPPPMISFMCVRFCPGQSAAKTTKQPVKSKKVLCYCVFIYLACVRFFSICNIAALYLDTGCSPPPISFVFCVIFVVNKKNEWGAGEQGCV